MLHIVWMILKIVGMILLGILGVLLFLLLAACFCPLRYQIEGSYRGKPKGEVCLSWFLKIIYVRLIYDGKKLEHKIRIFGFLIGKKKKDKTGKIRIKKQKSRFRKKKKNAANESQEQLSTKKEQGFQNEKKTMQEEMPEESFDEEYLKQKQTIEELYQSSNDDVQEKEKDYDSDKKPHKPSFLERIKQTYKRLKETYHSIIKKKHWVEELWKRPQHKKAFRKLKKVILKLIRHILPRKISLQMQFGFDDPSLTGLLLGGISMIPFSCKKNVVIQPNFECAVFDGEIKAKGYIRMIHFLVAILGIILYKECRILYRYVIHR